MVSNISKFTKYDVLRTFFLLKSSMSRFRLVSELEIGEGTLRTILDILKKNGLIASSKKGHWLSEKGKRAYAEIEKNISVPVKANLRRFFQHYYNTGIVIKKYNPKHKVSYMLRDAAIKNGAEAALVFEFRDGLKLLDAGYKGTFEDLEKQFTLKSEDVFIVTSSKTRRWAEISALAVCCELNEKIKRFCK